jgi:uncharacterized protein YigE (DUF2233 family)
MLRIPFQLPHGFSRRIAACCLALGFLMGAAAADLREEKIQHAGVSFRVVRVAPEKLRVVWKDAQGQPYQTFGRVQAAFKQQGQSVKFITNAGIFQPGGAPCGLHIEAGKELHRINLANAEGNFHLQPNGVVWVEATATAREPGLAATPAFLKRREAIGRLPTRSIQTAVQSGPMLLIDGKRHPAFIEGSPNRLRRNGVGVDANHQFVFAITDTGERVNFWDFAGLFLHLGCHNALFLDGNLSQMVVNPTRGIDSFPLGAMFVLAE